MRHNSYWTITSYMTRLRQTRAFLLLIALLIPFLGLALMAHSTGLLDLDTTLTRTLQKLRSPWLDLVMKSITLGGSTLTLLILGVCLAIPLHQKGHIREAKFILISLLSIPLNTLLKLMVNRPRPTDNLVDVLLRDSGTSFPSGHAMCSVIFYGFVAYLLYTAVPRTRRRKAAGLGLLLFAFCVGLSRIYVGIHWGSDVLGGWIAGLFFLLLLVVAYLPSQSEKREGATDALPPSREDVISGVPERDVEARQSPHRKP